MMRIARLIGKALIMYILYAILMVLLHPRFIYPFGDDVFDLPAFTQQVITERDVSVAMYEGDDDIAVMFFMGNGGALAYFTPYLAAHANVGRSVLAMEYPGGGGIPGHPSEAGMKADALAMYDWLAARHDGPIVVHGYSLGSGLAQYVAAARPVAAVLLDAPFVKICELMTRQSFLPACYLPAVQKWDATPSVAALSAPVLIQHGTADQLVPLSDGLRLAAMMQGAGVDVTMRQVAGAHHDNLPFQPDYNMEISEFLERVVPN